MRARAFDEFCAKNEELRKAGTGAQGYAATMVPMVVSISYINYAIVVANWRSVGIKWSHRSWKLGKLFGVCSSGSTSSTSLHSKVISYLQRLAGAERVFKVMDEAPEVDDGKTDLVRVRKTETGLEECKEKRLVCGHGKRQMAPR